MNKIAPDVVRGERAKVIDAGVLNDLEIGPGMIDVRNADLVALLVYALSEVNLTSFKSSHTTVYFIRLVTNERR